MPITCSVKELLPLSAHEIITKRKEECYIVDVRNFEEILSYGKINYSHQYREINIPYYSETFHAELESFIHEKIKTELKEKLYLFFICAHGVRSLHSAKLANKITEAYANDSTKDLDIECISIYEGILGKNGWKSHELPFTIL